MTVNRTIAPAIHDAIEFEYALPPVNKEKLDNGLPLYWLNAGVQGVVEIDWVFPAGIWEERKKAVAHATAGLLKNGTSKHTARQIHETLEFYGASLKVNAGNDYATVTLHTLTRHLAGLLPIVFELMTDSIFPEDEIQIHKQNAIQRLLVNLKQCEFVANREIDALLFGPYHPYGRYSKKEDIEALTRQDLLEFYKSCYNLADVRIFMGGKVGEAEKKILNDIFGLAVLQQAEIVAEGFMIPDMEQRTHRIANDPNGVQGAIRIGRLFPNRHHPDFAPMVVLNTLFGGYFGSRLMSNIREDKGYTYGIYCSLSPYKNKGSMIIHTEAGKDVSENAVNEIYHEMEMLTKEPASEEELLLVKNYLLGGLLGDLDGPFSILQRWRTLLLNDFDEAYFNSNVQVYKSVTAWQLQQLAIKYYVKDEFYEVVVV